MHIYQRSVKCFNIFYDQEDYLVFYTIFSMVAAQYDVIVLELCIMVDHVHILLSSMNMKNISDFIMHYTSMFVREYNADVGRKGPLFHKSFGSAPKRGSKSIRSAIVYIGNNPVEKDICKSADQYRWNFLSFMKHDGYAPSSMRKLPKRIQRLFKEVGSLRQTGAFLGYSRLRRMYKGLSAFESEMLTDYIIYKYFPFDRDALLAYYSSYDDMIVAMKSTSGNEYDIKEKYHPESGVVYDRISEVVRRSDAKSEIRNRTRLVTVMSADEKFNMARLIQRQTGASMWQIAKYLHIL